ncbi:toxin-antitoxin system, toxin component family protein [Streptomyces poriticola]|uniref:toxin-antitoxin system, toxin component family protein n=1 Tax=Streptomyces poriticola TaxID=3120506 RepID=UPI002FCE01B9
MGIAGARVWAARAAVALTRPRSGSAMRALLAEFDSAVRARPGRPRDVRELCRAVCEELAARRGRPIELRFDRFPDEIEVTGVWVAFQDFDLVIVEERAEEVQQLVILGHELWHMQAGHGHHDHGHGGLTGHAALADREGRRGTALAAAARNGSREAEEAEADDFGHRLAALFRPLLPGYGQDTPLDPVQRSLGYRRRGGGRR